VYEWLLRSFDSERTKGITADGFVDMYMWMVTASGSDEEVVWRDLNRLGYDRKLDLVGARSFVVSVHTDKEVQIARVAFDPAAYEDAMELPCMERGVASRVCGNRLTTYTYFAGFWGATVAVKNETSKPLTVVADATATKNIVRCRFASSSASAHLCVCISWLWTQMSSTGSLLAEVVVPPMETEIMFHLVPITRDPWSPQCSISIRT
jgi:hypothetical protein